jgi:pilus assembly protein Flp/PilA
MTRTAPDSAANPGSYDSLVILEKANPLEGGGAKPWVPAGSPGYRRDETDTDAHSGLYSSPGVYRPFCPEGPPPPGSEDDQAHHVLPEVGKAAFHGQVVLILTGFLTAEDGPTSVEYAVLLAMIIAVCVAAVQALGSSTKAVFANASLNSVAGS